ncbi:MAG: DUF2993 domain-containing protein [Actinomycetota bacterium]|nr:DUF2993 domain-containing protein [Actinomycetota bacterium]
MRRLVAFGIPLAVLAVLVVAQLVLPGIAARRLHDRLARSGQVLSVSVSAFPAIELLWHQADTVEVRLGRYRSTSGHLASLLDQSADVGSLSASATELDTGLLTLRGVQLRKQGSQLTGSAQVTEADLRTALPVLQSVTPVASGAGRLTLRGTATLLGVTATVDAIVQPDNGALIVAPQVPLGALGTVRVFSDPHVAVQSVAASRTPTGFTAQATGRLH